MSPTGDACALPAGHAGNHVTEADARRLAAMAQPAVATTPPKAGVDVPAVAVLLGGIMYAAGSALPWITATAAFVGTITRSGLEGGDGLITVVIGLLIAGIGLLSLSDTRRAGSRSAQIILCLVALGFAIYEITNIGDRIKDLQSGELGAIASVGIGLWIMAIGAIIALVGAAKRKGPGTSAPSGQSS